MVTDLFNPNTDCSGSQFQRAFELAKKNVAEN